MLHIKMTYSLDFYTNNNINYYLSKDILIYLMALYIIDCINY